MVLLNKVVVVLMMISGVVCKIIVVDDRGVSMKVSV